MFLFKTDKSVRELDIHVFNACHVQYFSYHVIILSAILHSSVRFFFAELKYCIVV